jgi:hypothetical protein
MTTASSPPAAAVSRSTRTASALEMAYASSGAGGSSSVNGRSAVASPLTLIVLSRTSRRNPGLQARSRQSFGALHVGDSEGLQRIRRRLPNNMHPGGEVDHHLDPPEGPAPIGRGPEIVDDHLLQPGLRRSQARRRTAAVILSPADASV